MEPLTMMSNYQQRIFGRAHMKSKAANKDKSLMEIVRNSVKHINQFLPGLQWVAFAFVRMATYPPEMTMFFRRHLAHQGLVYMGNLRVACAYCTFQCRVDNDLELVNNVRSLHSCYKPDCCTFSHFRNRANNIRGELNLVCWKAKTLREQQYDQSVKKCPDYATMRARLASYKSCHDPNILMRRKEYAKNGFFYCFGGIIRCYYCGGCLYHLNDQTTAEENFFYNNVPYLHSYFYKDCLHSKFYTSAAVSNKAFIDGNTTMNNLTWIITDILAQVTKESGYRTGIPRSVIDKLNVNDAELRNLMNPLEVYDLEAGNMVADGGGNSGEGAMMVAVPSTSSSTGGGGGRDHVVVDDDEEEEQDDDERFVVHDNTCAVCLGSSADVLFLPCTHLCCCKRCTLNLENQKCIICRDRIIRYVVVKYA